MLFEYESANVIFAVTSINLIIGLSNLFIPFTLDWLINKINNTVLQRKVSQIGLVIGPTLAILD